MAKDSSGRERENSKKKVLKRLSKLLGNGLTPKEVERGKAIGGRL